ncbi:MAG: response regulator [Burkholderiales bacterium]|nr:response regulator [Burkholderiales bacterium]
MKFAGFLPTRFLRIRRSFRFGPIERRLFLIVLAGLLPLALFAFETLVENAENQKRQLIAAVENTMQAIGTAADSELNLSIASLDALASSPRLANRDFAGFAEEAGELLVRRPNWVNVILSEPSAQQVVNVRHPLGAPLPKHVDLPGIEAAVRTGKSGINNVIYLPVLKMYSFAAQVPIKEGDRVAYVLSAMIQPESILDVLRKQNIPTNGVVGIFDRNNNFVARSLDQEKWIGKAPSPDLLQMLKEGKNGGWGVTNTLESKPVYSIYRRSRSTGWSVAIGIPADVIDASITRSYILLGGGIAISALVGIFAAFLIGRTITNPMHDLERAADAIASGKTPPAPDTNLPEIRQVAMALAAAHVEREKSLQSERIARRQETEARLLAENANKAKDEFVAMLGHELRNPLAAITTASQILEFDEHAPSKEAASQAKAIIRRQVRLLSRLTDDMLDAGRVMQGKVELNRKPIDLASIVRGSVDTLWNAGRLTDYELDLSLTSVWVEGDTSRIDQIAANLLINAVKFTPAHGTIGVSVKREGDEAVFRVRDTGLGLDPEMLPRIFDFFVQGTRSLAGTESGLGVGLALVKRLSELHGGHVEARSAGPNQGSEFIVRLPAIDKPEPQAPIAPLFAAEKHCRIVIVEDNNDVRTSLRDFLALHGHQVVEAADGPSGIETILRERAEIALVDVGLPGLDGFGVARAVRQRAKHHVRLIALTGFGSAHDIQRGTDAGFDSYLVKPIELDRLNEEIGKA